MTSLCLTRAGAAVHVLNPLLAPRLQSTANALHEHKTDHIDVARLCEIGRLYVADLDRSATNPTRRAHGPVPSRLLLPR
jgi:hypothetical protein